MKRYIWPVLIALALILGGWGWYANGARSSTQVPQVMTSSVTRGAIQETVLAEGTLKPSRLVAVGAQVTGRITSVHVVAGQEVKAGDLIAEIDSVTQRNQLRTAEAALANVQAQKAAQQAALAQARRVEERQKRMLTTRTVAQADYDASQEAVEVAEAQINALDAQIEQARVAIETAQANLDYTRITAPIDGTVLAVVSQEGQTVSAVQSAPTIVVLGKLDEMTVRAEISEADITRVIPGQDIWFTILGDTERRFQATLRSIEPAPESIVNDSSITGTVSTGSTTSSAIYYNGIFDIPNTDGHLRTYMTAQVHIVIGSADDALLIPVTALGDRQPDGTYLVRIRQGDRVVSRNIRVGLDDKAMAEVLDGLSEGDQVVTGEAAGAMYMAGGARRGRGPFGF